MRDLEVMPSEPGTAGSADAETLVRRAMARDEAAWAALFEAHFRPVYAFVRARLGDPGIAEDIAAQVFEVAYSRIGHFDDRGVPIEAWFIGIARNLVRDHVKKAARRGPEGELMESTMPAEPDSAPALDLRADLARAMGALTGDQQAVLTYRFLADRSIEETARLMDRSEDAVKTLQRRALAAMQRALAGGGDGRG